MTPWRIETNLVAMLVSGTSTVFEAGLKFHFAIEDSFCYFSSDNVQQHNGYNH
jgi:hypothetical protein